MRALAFLLVLLLSACATPAPRPVSFDQLAREYVGLILEIGEHEAGYVDAYYGPPEWREQAKRNKRSVPALKAEAERLLTLAAELPPSDDQLVRKRRAFLLAHLRAARFRLNMIEGSRPPFQDEAEALFGVRPELRPLSAYDPVLARIEAIVPDGRGTLAERVERYRQRYVIPKDRLDRVMRAAIAECRRRTAQHIQLPPDEAFTLEFVTGKSWSGYNYYQGRHKSLIQINTDLPIYIDRAVDLGCHEGYPGHHTHNVLLESRLVERRGFTELSVYPLFSPVSFIAEGTSNYGIDLAFPGLQRTAFEAQTLYPLAGLNPAGASAYARLREALRDLQGARFTIAADYLDGRITRAQALELVQRYQLVSRERAEQSLRFNDEYRSYVINYGLGQDRARAHVEAAGATPAARWDALERLLSEPTLPSDLRR
ncbi:MAG: hypothetical protein M3M95_03135 [Pseudomonadota bacterium]|nr:hypothetical protein [Pseudomonadota bacterium]